MPAHAALTICAEPLRIKTSPVGSCALQASCQLASCHCCLCGHAVQLVEKVLYERYFKNNRPLPRITTTGHSLGAALATLCAFHIAWELPHTKRVAGHDIPEDSIFWAQLRSPGAVVAYPLASPRLCDERFAEVVNSTPGLKVLRTTNLCDFVPRVPLPDKDDPNLLGK
eukprot:GHUV01052094.1.p1 GENE.GHUV01052094.1~~GHUV01052094.1.p1  ORF type:complete len:169 (+),score=14.84 GHUV01052094.1:149-655(+)